ncbi:MAG: heme biosynthesis protein HemY [Alphaproteobacteria bacterium]|nr:heme biosynthesis protein HemY [Alphaproteobacteria bacterium]
MIRALWTLIKISAVIALVVWVAHHPGTVRIQWMDYTLTAHVGLFLLLLLGIILLSIFIYQTLKAFITFPSSYRRYSQVRAREKGYQALTRGLTAVAAGDVKTAKTQAARAAGLMPDDTGLPLLLQAQAARLQGHEEEATRHFMTLLENKDASFLGMRGLLQKALDQNNPDAARALSDKALKLHPKQPWLLKIAYDLHIRAKEWDGALKLLYRLEKAGGIDTSKASKDRVALLLAEAFDQDHAGRPDIALQKINKARSFAPDFAPVTLALIEHYKKSADINKARNALKKAWKQNPHEAYIPAWESLLKDNADVLETLRHFENLLKINADSAALQRRTGQAALEAGLWGKAREYFTTAEQLGPSAQLYRLWAQLEERSTHDETAIKHWLEKASEAEGESTWVCTQTGRVYDHWHPIALPHGAFNTIEWCNPAHMLHSDPALLLSQSADMAQSMIESP